MRWRIDAVRARVAAWDTQGLAWDVDGSAPDVFVEMTCPPSTNPAMATTDTHESSNPVWSNLGCAARRSELLAEPIRVTVYDEDILFNDIVADFTLQLTAAHMASPSSSELTIQPVMALESMTLRLTRQE